MLKEIKTFVQRRNDRINYFAFSDIHMKIKVEHFNDELPLKIKFIDNNVVIHFESIHFDSKYNYVFEIFSEKYMYKVLKDK